MARVQPGHLPRVRPRARPHNPPPSLPGGAADSGRHSRLGGRTGPSLCASSSWEGILRARSSTATGVKGRLLLVGRSDLAIATLAASFVSGSSEDEIWAGGFAGLRVLIPSRRGANWCVIIS